MEVEHVIQHIRRLAQALEDFSSARDFSISSEYAYIPGSGICAHLLLELPAR